MRVVISAPRKSGGAQLRCLVSMAYDLKAPPLSAPPTSDPAAIVAWLSALPDGSVTTCNFPRSLLGEPAIAAQIQLIGVVRHPFDLFVSNFDVAQQRAARGRDDETGDATWAVLSGEELGSEMVQHYATADFAAEVDALQDWSRNVPAVRYEDLLEDACSTLRSISHVLGPLSDEQMARVVGLCPADNVVASRPGRGRRMPSLSPGSWRERLPEAVLQTLRANYGAEVSALGYDAT